MSDPEANRPRTSAILPSSDDYGYLISKSAWPYEPHRSQSRRTLAQQLLDTGPHRGVLHTNAIEFGAIVGNSVNNQSPQRLVGWFFVVNG